MFCIQANHKIIVPIIARLAVAVALLVLATGCGGNQSPPVPTTQTQTASVHLGLGDTPSDWVMSFTMTINSVQLNSFSGGPVSMLASPVTVEFSHMMGNVEPLTIMSVPLGTYSSVMVSVSNAHVTYLDLTTGQPVSLAVSPSPATVTINFASPVTVGTSPMALNLDLDLGDSVSMSGSSMAVAPSFASSMAAMPGESQQTNFTGAMNDIMGMVTGVSGSSFTMSTLENGQMTFMTNSSTQFENMTGMGMMSNSQMVNVDAVTQSDGSLLATKVEGMMSGSTSGMDAAGMIYSVIGAPPTQIQLIMMDGEGSLMSTSQLGGSITVSLGSGTTYGTDTDGVDLTGMTFTFDASSIAPGQNVEADTSGGMTSGGGMMGGGMMNEGSFSASAVILKPQGMIGTVSNYTAGGGAATFTLTVPADSAFTTITKTTTITVYQQNGTSLMGMSSVTNGSTVVVRGLLFYKIGGYSLVSSLIGVP